MNFLWLAHSMRDPKLESAIELAKRLGTLNQADRSAQYRDASLPALLRSHNKQWEVFRIERSRYKTMIWILGGALAGCWALVLTLVSLLFKG